MSLPSSPPLYLTQILSELGRLAAGQTLSGAADERALSGIASGTIHFSDYLGKSSWSVTEVGASGGVYSPGSGYDALVICTTYSSTNGAVVTMNDMNFGGQECSIQVKEERLNASNVGVGAAIGIYTGSLTSGAVTFSSTGSNGATVAVRVFKIVGYAGVHDVANSTATLTTVNGKAAFLANANSGVITTVIPTTGANIASGSIYQAGLSLA